jgi:hypothetical protein
MPKPPPPPSRKKPAPAGPPKPKGPEAGKPPAEALAEVERALSILHGRHPEAVRAERETQTALDKKRTAADAISASAALHERRVWLRRGTAGFVLAAVATTLAVLYSRHATRTAALTAALAPKIAPYVAAGFTNVPSSRFGGDLLELSVEEPTCFVAIASRSSDDGSLHVDRPSGPLDGTDSVAWCTCGAERDSVRSATPDTRGGFAVLRVAAAEVGGDYGLYFLNPRPNLIAPPDECGSPSLDAWIEKGRAPVNPITPQANVPSIAHLKDNGFTAVGGATSALPFAVVPLRAESCLLAWSTSPEDVLSLRIAGTERPISDAVHVLGTCSEKAKSATVWRKGTGDLVAFRVGAARIGGSHGLREAAARLGFGKVTVWASDDDLGWDASSTLRASGVAAPEISVSTDGKAPAHTRLVALSIDGAIVRADAKEDAWACEPPLGPTATDAVCVESLPIAWRATGPVGKAGIAESAFPFWVSGFGNVSDPGALRAVVSVLKLGRRLVAEGFEPTTLEGVTETPLGARVTGRAGDDAIVALTQAKQAPWVALCHRGDDSNLEIDVQTSSESPEVTASVPLSPGAQLDLLCPLPGVELHDRKTVVFRHVANAPAK